MPRRSLEEILDDLNRLRDEPVSEKTEEKLGQAIRSKNSFAVARAAEIAGELEIAALADELGRAFDRFMDTPLKSDKGCRAKTAIADALYRLGHDAEDVFLRGIRHVQLEPVWGGRDDSAVQLRSICALGLVKIGYFDVLNELARLLADPEAPARAAAARAIGCTAHEGSVPLLRFKALIGDEEPSVLSECLGSLLDLAPETSFPFVAAFLERGDPTTEELAALALGASRRSEALGILREWFERQYELPRRRTGLLAIAMLRRDESFDFLLDRIANAEPRTAELAVSVLEMYFEDGRLLERVREAVGKRDDSLTLPESIRRELG